MELLIKEIVGSGYASKSDALLLIKNGLVKVDGIVITDPGYEVNEKQVVTVDNEKIKKKENLVYYMVNKPVGYLSQTKEDKFKKTLGSLIDTDIKLYTLGRLESYMSGLLILTNDKEYVDEINNSEIVIEKEYKIKVEGLLRKEESYKITKGIDFKEYKSQKCRILDVMYNDDKTSTTLTLIIKENKNREVERIFESVNHKIKSIKRVRYGNLRLDIDNGCYRRLKPHEIKLLKLFAIGKINK